MNRAVLIAAVSLGGYVLLDVALSALVAIAWRTRAVAPANLPPAGRARRLLCLRFIPGIGASLFTLAIVTPAFAIHEPVGLDERMGPALVLLGAMAIFQFAAAALVATRSALLTARIERIWLRSAAAIDSGTAGSLPAFVVESASPIVALVGVFSPKLIAARTIVDACSPQEVASIVGHERGHWQARDNLKRWIIGSLPDWLRWTPIHREIVTAWHQASEDAADDATTGRDPVARAELAALLLKVVRLAPRPVWESAIVSPFVERHGLDRRVRRLLRPDLEPPAPLALVPVFALTVIAAAGLAVLSLPAALRSIFTAFETLVALGR